MNSLPAIATPSLLSRLWAHEKTSQTLRMFIALAATVAAGWKLEHMDWVPNVLLGVIASALAETDDNWLGRLKAVALMMVCFVMAAVSTLWLFPHPLPFVLALAVSTLVLTLLGSLGERYTSIAVGTEALAIYVMTGADQAGHGGGLHDWHSAALILAGALWYGLVSILWAALFASRPVRERLAVLFIELGRFAQLKAELFEPLRHVDEHAQRLALAEQNVRVVAALDGAKNAILNCFGRSGRPGVQSGLYFRLYYLARDFHERASSSYYPYHALAQAFFHSDVLYRCGHLLTQQGQACIALSQAIRLHRRFVYGQATAQAMGDLDESLAWLHTHGDVGQARLLGSLDLLARNLRGVERELSEMANPQTDLENVDAHLHDLRPHTLKQMATRLGQQLTLGSVLFRYGLRMAIALAASYATMQALHATNGFWILVTTLVVCQPTFGATRLRLVERVLGTLVGLGLTWMLMQLFPWHALHLLIALAATPVFLATRSERYMVATAAITVMVLLCFNLIGDSFVLLVPRLVDTLVGCTIAAAAAFLILPDWQGRNLHKVAAAVMKACARYLDVVMAIHHAGHSDDTAYHLARRDMHNACAALSTALSNMLRDPPHERRNLDAGFRFLALSNTAVSYFSALGAHRTLLSEHPQDAALITSAGQCLSAAMASMADTLAHGRMQAPADTAAEITQADALESMPENIDEKHHLIRTQLALELHLLPQLRHAADAVLRTGPISGDETPAGTSALA